MSTKENAPRERSEFVTTNNSNANQDQVPSQSNFHPLFCSGYGQYHTNEKCAKKRQPYAQISFCRIRELVDNPRQVDKADGQWLIPSTLMSRTFKEQEAKGEYWLLWADIDHNFKNIQEIAKSIEFFIDNCDFEIYTTKSATEVNQKCRILIPLNKPLSFVEWSLTQEILNDRLEQSGITPDRANERAAQLCYLPNQGEFYDSKSKRDGQHFDIELWCDAIERKNVEIKKQEEEAEKRRNAAKLRREALNSQSNPNSLPELIGAFNYCYNVEDILLKAGYDQHPHNKFLFRHPASESGNYSASIKDGRVNSLSTSDLLYSNGQGAHDAFSAFKVLFHHGNQSEALKDAGNRLMIGGESWNTVNQRKYAQCKQASEAKNHDWTDEGAASDSPEAFSFKKFDITGDVEEMRKKMLNDVFVMDNLALLGQLTAIYAAPNTGKTLLTIRMLIDSVKAGRINGGDIYYINADDTHKGLITKAEIFKAHSMNLIAPGHNGFEVKNFIKYLDQLIQSDSACGVIVVLDTLKKFSDLMDKTSISRFMVTARSFVAKGGTMIMLAHTNKRRDSDNKLIMGGTSDVVDDADCAFIIDAKPTILGDTTKTIIFENTKSRGDVARELCFSYSIVPGESYKEKLESVKMHTQKDLDQARREAEEAATYAKDSYVIEIIMEAIREGITKKTELVNEVSKNGGGSLANVRKILDRYQGKHWGVISPGKNSSVYHLIGTQSTTEEYQHQKDGW